MWTVICGTRCRSAAVKNGMAHLVRVTTSDSDDVEHSAYRAMPTHRMRHYIDSRISEYDADMPWLRDIFDKPTQRAFRAGYKDISTIGSTRVPDGSEIASAWAYRVRPVGLDLPIYWGSSAKYDAYFGLPFDGTIIP